MADELTAGQAPRRHASKRYEDDGLYEPASKFERIAGRFGVPVAMLFFVGLAVWVGGGWFANHVALPLVDRHMKFLDASQETMQSTAKVIQVQVEATKDVAIGLQGIEKKQDETHELLGKLVDEQIKTNRVIERTAGKEQPQ